MIKDEATLSLSGAYVGMAGKKVWSGKLGDEREGQKFPLRWLFHKIFVNYLSPFRFRPQLDYRLFLGSYGRITVERRPGLRDLSKMETCSTEHLKHSELLKSQFATWHLAQSKNQSYSGMIIPNKLAYRISYIFWCLKTKTFSLRDSKVFQQISNSISTLLENQLGARLSLQTYRSKDLSRSLFLALELLSVYKSFSINVPRIRSGLGTGETFVSELGTF